MSVCAMCSGVVGKGHQTAAAAPGPRLAPVLQSSRHRQAALLKHTQPPALEPSDPQIQSQGSGKLQKPSQGSGQPQSPPEDPARPVLRTNPKPEPVVSSERVHPNGQSQDWSAVSDPPSPMPVKADPNSHPPDDDDTAQQLSQQQHGQQQQQQQQQGGQNGVAGGLDLAKQARESFERSVSQSETRGVEEGSGDSGTVLLQACLHRFVRPETLHRWVCSRCAPFFLFSLLVIGNLRCLLHDDSQAQSDAPPRLRRRLSAGAHPQQLKLLCEPHSPMREAQDAMFCAPSHTIAVLLQQGCTFCCLRPCSGVAVRLLKHVLRWLMWPETMYNRKCRNRQLVSYSWIGHMLCFTAEVH